MGIPAKAGILVGVWTLAKVDNWVPASAGMTGVTGRQFRGDERRRDD